MSFAASFDNGPYRAEGGKYCAENWTFLNGASDTGGAITARNIKRIVKVDGAGFLTATISGTTVTILCDPDSDGNLEIIGDQN